MMKNREASWLINRRKFIRGVVAAGIYTKIGFLESCVSGLPEKSLANSFFSDDEMSDLYAMGNRLFPNDGNGPNIQDINAIPHILWTLRDEYLGFDAYDLFQSSLKKLSLFSLEKYSKTFVNLKNSEQDSVIESISKMKWGDRFLSKFLYYIFEALSIDPYYSVNTNEAGWKWLRHKPGQPQPEQSDLYPAFLNKWDKNV